MLVRTRQPPSGGCVLKQYGQSRICGRFHAAAFGRLCVETTWKSWPFCKSVAAAFGRLCVETATKSGTFEPLGAAAFGRLCVETLLNGISMNLPLQPPSGGCVLKRDTWASTVALTGSRLRAAVC